ncbi:MAG: helix-turn-helix domain-containing protein [Burkholderiaceae bacterium]
MATAVKSAQRVLELLEYFAEERRPAAVGEIAQTLGWPQSSTSVLLKCLSEAGYFDQDARRGMYVPNVRLALATAWIQEHLYSDSNLLRLLEQVKDRSGHTVSDRATPRRAGCAACTCCRPPARDGSWPKRGR